MTKSAKPKLSLSLSDKVILATFRVAGGTTNRISFEAIALQAGRDYPTDFGFKDHPEYPDASVVYQKIYADLIAKRLMVSLRKQVLRLTEKGIEHAKALDEKLNTGKTLLDDKSSQLNREQQAFLDHALKSRAFLTWQSGEQERLIEYDVKVFLQFSTGTPTRERKRKLDNARETIDRAVELNFPQANLLSEFLDLLAHKFPTLFEEIS